MSPRPEQSEAGMGDGSRHRHAAVGVEASSLAEDEHQVPAPGDEQTAGHRQGASRRHSDVGRLHGPARVHR